jgi:hypothetical protein
MRYAKPGSYVHPATGRVRSKTEAAIIDSKAAILRYLRLREAARFNPPRQAQGRFPFPHRSCAEWLP